MFNAMKFWVGCNEDATLLIVEKLKKHGYFMDCIGSTRSFSCATFVCTNSSGEFKLGNRNKQFFDNIEAEEINIEWLAPRSHLTMNDSIIKEHIFWMFGLFSETDLKKCEDFVFNIYRRKYEKR